jgi:predicted anti-sigma-YlaC factor YlaD
VRLPVLARRPATILLRAAAVELLLFAAHAALIELLDGKALAASMLGGRLTPSLIAGVTLVLVRLAAFVFVPMLGVGLAVRAFVLGATTERAHRPRSHIASASDPTPSRS